MNIIYGKGSERIDLTNYNLEVNWSSSRGQIAQTCDVAILESPPLSSAGFLMLFEGGFANKNQLFHGPIVNFLRDDATNDLNATAYELSWYFMKNDLTRQKLSGDGGKELSRVFGNMQIKFSCPSLGFTIKERTSAQSFASFYSMIMDKAYEETGIRYFLEHERDKLTVKKEGSNSEVPVYQAMSLDSCSTGESIEEVYNVIRVERYKDDKLLSVVTKTDATSVSKIGRMQKIIDVSDNKNLSTIGDRELKRLSKIPITRSIIVKHNDLTSAKIRAGWRIDIIEKDNVTTTSWIVTSCRTAWKHDEYTMSLDLERR